MSFYQTTQIKGNALVRISSEVFKKFFVGRFKIDRYTLQTMFLVPPDRSLGFHLASTTKVSPKANDCSARKLFFSHTIVIQL